MGLKIEFETDNAAFDDAPEIEAARILRDLADKLESHGHYLSMNVRDVNGNTIGRIEFEAAP